MFWYPQVSFSVEAGALHSPALSKSPVNTDLVDLIRLLLLIKLRES